MFGELTQAHTNKALYTLIVVSLDVVGAKINARIMELPSVYGFTGSTANATILNQVAASGTGTSFVVILP